MVSFRAQDPEGIGPVLALRASGRSPRKAKKMPAKDLKSIRFSTNETHRSHDLKSRAAALIF